MSKCIDCKNCVSFIHGRYICRPRLPEWVKVACFNLRGADNQVYDPDSDLYCEAFEPKP
jgi:hypothetical protein